MGFLSDLFGGGAMYSASEFCDIVERHCEASRERELEKMHFMFGDKEKFLRTLEYVKNEYVQASASASNPKWRGHNFAQVLDEGADRIRAGQAVAWGYWDWITDHIRKTYE
jgi:hypothetical protein